MLTGGKVTIFDQIKIYLAGLRAQGSGHRAQGTGHGERTASGVRPAACGQRRGEYERENRRKGDEETTRRLYRMDPLLRRACPAQRGGLGWVLVKQLSIYN